MESRHSRSIEIEFRSRFGKKKYLALRKFLSSNAKDLGEDDKDVYFFILPDKLLKIVDNVSRKTAKLVLKLNKIGKGSDFEEIEIPINPRHVKSAVKMFSCLGYREIQRSFQKRHNYLYKGVELSLKYSKVWGYHLELEMVVRDAKRVPKAESAVMSVAKKLGVRIMTDRELAEFTKKKDREYRKRNK
jgi:predicted adenylyl cyclase CyaB